MTQDSFDDNIEEFEEDGDDFDDVPEVQAAEVGAAKKPKRVKKEAAPKPERVSKAVTVKVIEPETLYFPPDEFAVTLNSVSGRDYQFGDPAPLLMWVTRRIYNGEDISPGVEKLHRMLSQIRFMTTLDRRLQELDVHNTEEADFVRNNTWNAYKRLGERVQEAVVSIENIDATKAHIQRVVELKNYIDLAINTPLEESKVLVEAAHEITAEDGSKSMAEATYKTTSTANARREAANTISRMVQEIRSERLYLKDFLSADV